MAHEIPLPDVVVNLLSSFDHRGELEDRIEEVIAVSPLPPVIDRNPLLDIMDGRTGSNKLIDKELKKHKGKYKNLDEIIDGTEEGQEKERLKFMKKAKQRAEDQHNHLVEAMEQNNLNTLHVINLVRQMAETQARLEDLETRLTMIQNGTEGL